MARNLSLVSLPNMGTMIETVSNSSGMTKIFGPRRYCVIHQWWRKAKRISTHGPRVGKFWLPGGVPWQPRHVCDGGRCTFHFVLLIWDLISRGQPTKQFRVCATIPWTWMLLIVLFLNCSQVAMGHCCSKKTGQLMWSHRTEYRTIQKVCCPPNVATMVY